MEFSRSTAFCENNTNVREQFNGITAFVDASNVYGSDTESARTLRSFIGGQLRVEFTNFTRKEMLPRIRGNSNSIILSLRY